MKVVIDWLDKKNMVCPCCGEKTNLRNVNERSRIVTIYGMSLKELSEVINFAIQHGYEKKNL